MYARNVMIHLKPNSVSEFTRSSKDILPLLRKQNGFTDEITFLAEGGRERSPSACGIARRARSSTAATPIPRCSRA